MRVGYALLAPEFGEVARNLNEVATRLSRDRADLRVLPDLVSTGYQFTSQRAVQDLAGPVRAPPPARG